MIGKIVTGASSKGGSIVERTRLDNGVRVVSEHIPAVRSVCVGVWIDTGSRDESPHEAGISHFIEHMVFKGTQRRRTHHIAQRMESVGGYLNAFTGKEITCYFARALDEHMDRAIDTLTDLVMSPSFPKREIEKEKEVVVEEMRMYEDAPEDLAIDGFEQIVYGRHALGRPVIGLESSVRSFSRSDLLRYVQTRYTPDRIVVAVAGNCSHARATRVAEKTLGKLRRTPGPRRRRKPGAYRSRFVVRKRPLQQAHIVLGLRALGIKDPDRSAMSLLNTILGGGMSSLLNQNIREKYGYCYSIYSFVNMHSDTGDMGVYMGTDGPRVERSVQLIRREMDRLLQADVPPRTLSRAKNQIKGSLMMGLESMSNRMMRIGRQELTFRKHIGLDAVLDEIDAVSAADIRRVAERVLGPHDFSVMVLEQSEEGAA